MYLVESEGADVSAVDADGTVVEFDPPFDPPATMLSASCSCGDILGLRCEATFLFNASALAESLVGHNITARLGLTNGTYLTTWTRVATVMPAPVLVASTTTQVPQFTTTFTVEGRYLGLPATNTRGSGGDQDLHLFFKDANDNNVEAQVAQVSDDATSAKVTFTAGGPQALGPLWACVELWGALTDYVQVATVVEAKSGSGGDKVPWHIIIPVVASVGGVLVIAGVVAWALWLRRRRRCHYETISGYH